MKKEERIKDILEDIAFYESELSDILSMSGIWTERERLAVWTNIRLIKKLREELAELRNE